MLIMKKEQAEKIAEWINNNVKYYPRYYNERPRVKKIRENIEREERRRFDYLFNDPMGGRMMDSSWVIYGLDFEDAMELLEGKMNLTYGTFEKVRDDLYFVTTGGWSDNEHDIGVFNLFYGSKYSVCHIGGGLHIYAKDSAKYEKMIIDLLKDGECR